jgi:signal transduction histidine kinase
MVIVATCFVVVIGCYQSVVTLIYRDADEILSDAAPSAHRLVAVRTAIRRLDGALSQALLARLDGRPFDEAPIARARRQIDTGIASFGGMPKHGHEAELYAVSAARARRIDATADALVEALARHDLDEARRLHAGEWQQASDAFDLSLRNLIIFNVQHVWQAAAQISNWWRLSSLAALGLGTINVLVTVLVTVLAARCIRRQAKRQDQCITELDLFAHRVAHDLVSPIAGIKMALIALQARQAEVDEARMTAAALDSVKWAQQIVDAQLAFACAGGRPQPEALAWVPEIVGAVVAGRRQMVADAGIELTVDADEEAWACAVACAPGVLGVALGNLLDNAVKFMAASPERRIVLRVRAQGQRVRFEVEDTGPGLPFGYEQIVFEPYVRGPAQAQPGLGLGLATVRRLVDAHDGRLGVSGREGGGSLFWFELPTAREELGSGMVSAG